MRGQIYHLQDEIRPGLSTQSRALKFERLSRPISLEVMRSNAILR